LQIESHSAAASKVVSLHESFAALQGKRTLGIGLECRGRTSVNALCAETGPEVDRFGVTGPAGVMSSRTACSKTELRDPRVSGGQDILILFQTHQSVHAKIRGNRNCLDICDTSDETRARYSIISSPVLMACHKSASTGSCAPKLSS